MYESPWSSGSAEKKWLVDFDSKLQEHSRLNLAVEFMFSKMNQA